MAAAALYHNAVKQYMARCEGLIGKVLCGCAAPLPYLGPLVESSLPRGRHKL